MSKNKAATTNDNMNRLNRISPTSNVLFSILFLVLALMCFLPIIFIFIISITKNDVLRREGYQLFVTAETASFDAYTFLWNQKHVILNALVVSVKVTVIGTVLGVMLTCLMGYVLSRKEHKLNGFLTMLVFIPMVFGGGLASSYVVNTQILGLRDNLWVLILPLAVSSFNVTIGLTIFSIVIPNCSAN